MTLCLHCRGETYGSVSRSAYTTRLFGVAQTNCPVSFLTAQLKGAPLQGLGHPSIPDGATWPRPLGLGDAPARAATLGSQSGQSARHMADRTASPRQAGEANPWQRLALAIMRSNTRPRRLALEQWRQGIFRAISV